MTWLTYSLLSAFFVTGRDIITKHGLNRYDSRIVAFSTAGFALLVLLPIAFSEGLIAFDWAWFVPVLVSGTLNTVQVLLSVRAIQEAPLSLVAPIVAFVPCFIVFIEPIVIGETIPLIGVLGVFLVVGGSYALNMNQLREGIFQPLLALIRNRALRLMLIATFMRAVCSVFDKLGVQNSNAITYCVWVMGFVAVMLACSVLPRLHRVKEVPLRGWGCLLSIGVLNGFATILTLAAFGLISAAYVTSVRQLNLVLTVLIGGILFRESDLRGRVGATLVMILGVVVISFAS